MDTIDEQSKTEEMSISSTPTPENVRICLVGDVSNSKPTLEAAESFGVPVITSDTGIDIVSDTSWTTCFIMKDFECQEFETISKSKHRILGPSALQQAVKMDEGLTKNIRPVYNFSMRGVTACFSGLRNKEELARLVNLIHSMGGSIRKNIMKTKITHLICNSSSGEKYKYAKTFGMFVVRPGWVYDAWEQRDHPDFLATNDEITTKHTIRPFEELRICFFGFSPEEHEHMVDVLKKNGGIPTDLEDPECSHVIMANTDGHFPKNIDPSPVESPSQLAKPLLFDGIESYDGDGANNDVDKNDQTDNSEKNRRRENQIRINNNENENEKFHEMINESNFVENGECAGGKSNLHLDDNADEFSLRRVCIKVNGQECIDDFSDDDKNSTPRSSRQFNEPAQFGKMKTDGIVLTSKDSDEFLNPSNLSPILETPKYDEEISGTDVTNLADSYESKKRRRDSFDNVSMMSTDSIALSSIHSAKKPKLTRTGSVVRGLKRSMSFVANKTPMKNLLQSRRSIDPNASISSISSIEKKFNDSIRRPMKEKLRGIQERFTKAGKRELSITPKTSMTTGSASTSDTRGLKSLCKSAKSDKTCTPELTKITDITDVADSTDFKTPLAPPKSLSSLTHRHSVCGVGNINNNFNNDANLPDVSSPVTEPFITGKESLAIMATITGIRTTTTSTRFITENEFDLSLCPRLESEPQPQPQLQSQPPSSAHGDIIPVVDEHTVQTKPEPKCNRTHIVKADWFWYTIQNGHAHEMDYLFEEYLDSIANTPGSERRDSFPISFNKRKRKRFSQRLQSEGTPIGISKRRSSVSDVGLLSVTGSFLDCTASPDKHESTAEQTIEMTPKTPKVKSMRYNHFMDFYITESNYVGILDTIVNLFKIPLEEKAETSDALLNKSEVRSIFNNFLPIHDVHSKMLERLRELQMKWHEDCLIGHIILEHRDDLIKAYPPYVNFFEQMKETLIQCDTQNPRFHAFLKINQAKPECGRQTLQDLMIRPVQRLPSISLLLNDILKHTNKNNPDHKKLDEALKAIKEVMAHINEDKRKTEGQLAMFDIFNDIEGCPAQLVSSHRSFVSKCEVTELSDNLSGRGDCLVLYLFSDTIEVCKKRSRGFNSAKSPNTTKSFKHVRLMPLSTVRLVINIKDSPRAFALNCRNTQDNKEKLYCFNICDEEIEKSVYLRCLCKQMAENACRADSENNLIIRTSQELEVDISEVNLSTLSKAFKFATRTRLKVGRAFSFNKTPAKLKRAVSTMMPSPFGSTNSLTPASQLAQMKLASCTNINEVGDEDEQQCPTNHMLSRKKDVLVAPMSVQPTRKAKPFGIPLATLRRL